MKTLSIREMRSTLGRLETVVAESGEIIVTRHGKPVARILPVPGYKPKPSHAELRSKMPRLAASANLISADRDER